MSIANPLDCRSWYVTPELLAYHDHEWGRPVHDDRKLFEMLCLEGASVGLSWQIIMHKREAYRLAFHEFRIDACAGMSDEELEAQLSNLAAESVLGNFVGMLTDSRSFFSYARHEYFRRILCNVLGNWVENGEYPNDMQALGRLVQDICYNNAKDYFGM